jgi:hypothetical protein
MRRWLGRLRAIFCGVLLLAVIATVVWTVATFFSLQPSFAIPLSK